MEWLTRYSEMTGRTGYSMPKVFVVQNQHKWDADRGEFRPRFDLHTAEKYGQLEYLLTPTAAPFNPGPVVAELREKLSWFSEEDYLLLVGNPVLIGCAVALASRVTGGRVKVLQWSGTQRCYNEVQLEGLEG